MTDVLTNDELYPWITQPEDSDVEHFDPAAFVASRDTLYLLSEEEEGNNAGAIVTALTVAVVEAGRDKARQSPGGRLPVPLMCVLDEAANVCKWKKLPDLYSHLGSQGILVLTILQSYAQAEAVWGKTGVEKLWSSANFIIYGGGARGTEWLDQISQLIGDYDRPTRSITLTEDGHRSVNHDTRRERILSVAALAALPRRRAVVLASGAKPTLIRTTPWADRPDADQIRDSFLANDPHGAATLALTDRALAEEQAGELVDRDREAV